jgi:hypothetical protein
MSDLRNLTDAFAELERRADIATAGTPAGLPSRAVRRPSSRLVPVAAAVAVAAGLVTGVALLARDGGGAGTRTADRPVRESAPPPTEAGPRSPVTTDPQELAARFQVVLGDTATFVVTDTGHPVSLVAPPGPTGGNGQAQPPQPGTEINGAAISGTLTAYGVTGGFDLQIYQSDPGTEAWCADGSAEPDCTVTTLADGSSLAVQRMPLETGGVTFQVDLIRPDGVEILMHISNQRSPKGSSDVLAQQPPLTADQLVGIVTSDRW